MAQPQAVLQIRVEELRKLFFPVVSGLLLFGILYLVSFRSYLLFHGIVEVFSMGVAVGIFMVAWNSRRFLERSYFLVLGVAFLFIGMLDLLHMLAYQGMGVFPQSGDDLASQLWVGARLMQAVSFVVAPVFLRRTAHVGALLAAYTGAFALLLGAIFYWEIFPACFVEGEGLTPFKVGTEYFICVLSLYALGLHLQEQARFDPAVLRLITASLLVTVASELAFTLYVSVYGLSNMLGHVLKVLAFYLIYRALVEVALTKPFQLLFRDLKRSEEQMRRYQEHLERTNQELQLSLQQLADDENAARRIQFLLLPPPHLVCHRCEFQSVIHTSAFLSGDFVDYFPITDHLTGFYIADVSGHGVSSAFITVLLKSTMGHLLEEYQQGKDEVIARPAGVLKLLNDYLVQQHFGKYLTMFYGVVDNEHDRLLYSNAGQFPYPVLTDQTGSRFLEQKALPAGLFPETVYRTCELSIHGEFRLALFSDGIFDLLPQRSVRQKQEFLLSQVSAGDHTLERLEARLGLSQVQAPADDLTVMLLKTAQTAA